MQKPEWCDKENAKSEIKIQRRGFKHTYNSVFFCYVKNSLTLELLM